MVGHGCEHRDLMSGIDQAARRSPQTGLRGADLWRVVLAEQKDVHRLGAQRFSHSVDDAILIGLGQEGAHRQTDDMLADALRNGKITALST